MNKYRKFTYKEYKDYKEYKKYNKFFNYTDIQLQEENIEYKIKELKINNNTIKYLK